MPSSLAVLRDFMLQRYDDLKARLTRRLGCADMPVTPCRTPGCGWRARTNWGRSTARARTCCGWRSMWRWTSSAPKPPAHLQRGRGLARLARPRARSGADGARPRGTGHAGAGHGRAVRASARVLLAVRLEAPQAEVATRMGVSLRTVERECAARMNTVRRASVIYCHHKNASPRRIPAARTVIGVARGITARRRSMPASPYRENRHEECIPRRPTQTGGHRAPGPCLDKAAGLRPGHAA